MFKADVQVNFKDGVLDPQAKAISGALLHLGYDFVKELKVGKRFTLKIDAPDEKEAYALTEEIAKKVLSNPVLEAYTIQLRRDEED